MDWLERVWYTDTPWLLALKPLESLFSRLAARRRRAYRLGNRPVWKAPVPVVVVGNISVGGTGKTPLTVWLIERLREAGYRPGVVSRGYGGKAPVYPFIVESASPVEHAGDEPLMLVQRTGCPLVVAPRRVDACRLLLDRFDCDLIISDDGLQHYALGRDVEIAVVDGKRGLGNGHCLPVGPLREPPRRLEEVDFCVVNGEGWGGGDAIRMRLSPGVPLHLDGSAAGPLSGPVNAVAGIGNPQRFFDTLAGQGCEVTPRPFKDHHRFNDQDLCFDDGHPVVMTEKDAVKCRAFAAHNRYYLPVNAELPEGFITDLVTRLAALKDR